MGDYLKYYVTLPHMSIGTRVIVAVALQQVDGSPDAETGTECDDESLQYFDCTVEKFHNRFLLLPASARGQRTV